MYPGIQAETCNLAEMCNLAEICNQAEVCILAEGFEAYPGKGQSVQIGNTHMYIYIPGPAPGPGPGRARICTCIYCLFGLNDLCLDRRRILLPGYKFLPGYTFLPGYKFLPGRQDTRKSQI